MCKYWIYLSCLPIYLCVFIHMFSDKEPASESNNDVHRASYLLVFSYSERTHTSSNKNTHVSFVKYKYTSHSSNTNTSLIDRHVFSFKGCKQPGWQKLAGFRRAQKKPSILSSDAYLLIRDKKLCFFFRVIPKLQQKR